MRHSTFASFLAAGLFAALSHAGAATLTGSDSAVTTTAPAGDPNEMICRTHPNYGSHLMARECHSRREWTQMHIDARHDIEHLQNASAMGSNPGR